MFGGRRRRREEELAAKDRWRVARKLMDEDVTVLGEQVAELHVDTLGDDLDATAHDHYRRALESYDQAKQLLTASETAEDVITIEQVVADARYHRATAGPWHLAGSVSGAIDAGAQLAKSAGHGVHGQQNLAQVYLNQTTGGSNTGYGG
ncbi:hypothetical protein [Nocardioides sp.]|uniref:hypothetical protein n=1 Tax=Nocardioides sp. TaxID=35761 RepID=UPI0026345212|nr:hypothetical protein [Nocardioides sp.]MCW2736486.1 hypothetical protein [Nocardioides sp.]